MFWVVIVTLCVIVAFIILYSKNEPSGVPIPTQTETDQKIRNDLSDDELDFDF